MPLSEAVAPDYFVERRNRLGPYITSTQPVDAGDTPDQNRVSLDRIGTEIATALASKEDRRQAEQLSSGDVNNRGLFMAGVFDKKTGDITSLALATPTEAMLLAQRKTTVAERSACIKRILDTNNKKRPSNSTRALFRNMVDHDPVFATAVSKGIWSSTPRDTMDGKHTEASIFALIPLFKETLETLSMEVRNRKIRGGEEDDKTRGWIAVSARDITLTRSIQALANMMSAIEALYICVVLGETPIAYELFGLWLDFLNNTEVSNWFNDRNTADGQRNLLLFMFQSWDCLLSGLFAAGQDFTTHAAIQAEDATAISTEDYQTVLTAAIEDLADIKKAFRRNNPASVEPTLRVADPPRIPKKPRAVDGPLAPARAPRDPPPPQGNPTRPAPAPRRPGLSGSGSWDASWGGGAPRADNPNRNREASKKRGDIIVRRGSNFSRILHPDLVGKHCKGWVRVGKYYEGCDIANGHTPMFKWSEEDKQKQIAHVKANNTELCFNAKSVRFLSNDDKYLLGNEDGPLRLGENRN